MTKKIDRMMLTAEELNALYAEGYRYYVEGDYEMLDTTDPWSGMPNTTNNIYAFTDKAEADAYAVTQPWIFNEDMHMPVYTIPEHTKTREEIHAELEAEAAARRAKRLAREHTKRLARVAQ